MLLSNVLLTSESHTVKEGAALVERSLIEIPACSSLDTPLWLHGETQQQGQASRSEELVASVSGDRIYLHKNCVRQGP